MSKGLGNQLELVSTGPIWPNLSINKKTESKHINYTYIENCKNPPKKNVSKIKGKYQAFILTFFYEPQSKHN